MILKKNQIIHSITQKIDNKLFGEKSLLSKFDNTLNEIDTACLHYDFKQNPLITSENLNNLQTTIIKIVKKHAIHQSVEDFIKFNVLDFQNYILFYDSTKFILIDKLDLKTIQNKLIDLEAK